MDGCNGVQARETDYNWCALDILAASSSVSHTDPIPLVTAS